MFSLALVRSLVVGTARDSVTSSLAADLTMIHFSSMDHERSEHSVFGPTGSASRPSPTDPFQCVRPGRISPRGSTNCLNGSTALRPIGPQVAASSRRQPDLTVQLRQPHLGETARHTWHCGLRVAALPTRPPHDKFSQTSASLPQENDNSNSWRTWLSHSS